MLFINLNGSPPGVRLNGLAVRGCGKEFLAAIGDILILLAVGGVLYT
jgi:hypothetical protein